MGDVTLKPKAGDLAGPEIAMLQVPGDGTCQVWRPGEPPFEQLDD